MSDMGGITRVVPLIRFQWLRRLTNVKSFARVVFSIFFRRGVLIIYILLWVFDFLSYVF